MARASGISSYVLAGERPAAEHGEVVEGVGAVLLDGHGQTEGDPAGGLIRRDAEGFVRADAGEAGDPDGPLFIYDGGDTALLFRDWTSNVRLNGIGLDARPELTKADMIFVVEMADGEVAREYAAPIRHVRDVKSLMV